MFKNILDCPEDLEEMERLENEELTEDDFSDPSEWEEYNGGI